jgi:enamine deaminase RidA (YjgF/YER057c/UK114 family)
LLVSNGFFALSGVVDGASNLAERNSWGGAQHARSAVGSATLPINAPVEIELVVAIDTR